MEKVYIQYGIHACCSPSLDGSVAGAGSGRGTSISTATAASRVWATAQRGFRSFLNDRSESPASDSSSANNGRRMAGERGELRKHSYTVILRLKDFDMASGGILWLFDRITDFTNCCLRDYSYLLMNGLPS